MTVVGKNKENKKMEIKIDLEVLRQKKIFLATPMYGGIANGMYTRSLCDLTALCVRYGIELRSYFLFNESLITRARNYCADEFMRSGADHLLFIDSDIGFNPQDVIAMMALQAADPEKYNVIGGPYPKKCITWEKIKAAVDKGIADDNPNQLEDFVGDFVFNPVITGEQTSIRLDEPAEVLEIGTGFMMVTRQTFEKFAKEYPHYSYKPDHVRTEAFDGSREIMMFFQAEKDGLDYGKFYAGELKRLQGMGINDPDRLAEEINNILAAATELDGRTSKRYLSEDYWFCQLVRKIGLKVWLCPWMHLQHAGTYVFAGKLPALASIGASATADAELLKKFKSGGQAAPVNQAPAATPVIANDPNLLNKFKKT
jgi:hypothetical protein